MSKRKAVVKDIIYELDNEDIELSSEDEATDAKILRSQVSEADKNSPVSHQICPEVINLDSSIEENCAIGSPGYSQNGGNPPDVTVFDSAAQSQSKAQIDTENYEVNPESLKTTILDEDILVDSPASNSDFGVVGCENRTPLVTVRFKDQKMAKAYKNQIKTFMLKLIKLHDEENLTGSESETDIELDIWPEDFTEEPKPKTDEEDNLFFVDTVPGFDSQEDIPTYRQNASLISNVSEKETTPPPVFRRGPTCFNCDGAHPLRDCKLPRNKMKIDSSRKNMSRRVGRYHVEDDQKYGHLVPGRISGQLRHALGLKRHELPPFIYRMRLLGYPPGWLEDARISHSGLTMFDSSGCAIQDPEEEDGEVCEPGCKDKFDIKKILDFPGFNVPASSRYKEEGHLYGFPPMAEQDSKLVMLQVLAPNAMKAYKRKKLTLFPTGTGNDSLTMEGQAEMDLDDGEEIAEFPSIPPLPDEAPPAPPPPPPPLPDTPPPPGAESQDEKSSSDIEVIEVIKVNDIPVPKDDGILDLDVQVNTDLGRESPSLDDLEEKKRKLLDALQSDGNIDLNGLITTASESEDAEEMTDDKGETLETKPESDEKDKSDTETDENDKEEFVEQVKSAESEADSNTTIDSKSVNESRTSFKTGHVKSSSFGIPVMNIASSYTKLPSDDKFAKDICDIMYFENLPNSTGKYKKISLLLKKVKSEVDRIQES